MTIDFNSNADIIGRDNINAFEVAFAREFVME